MIDPVYGSASVFRSTSQTPTSQGNGAFAGMVSSQGTTANNAAGTASAPAATGGLLQRYDFMSEVYGSAWNADTGKVDFQKFLANTAQRTSAFGDKLEQRMLTYGIDTSQPIKLTMAGDGSVRVDGDHPDKERIEQMFANDPQLADEYHKVAGANEWAAMAQITGSYTQAYTACTSDSDRDAVWSRYFGYEQQLSKVGSKMTLAGGQLTSAAMTALAQISSSAGLGLV